MVSAGNVIGRNFDKFHNLEDNRHTEEEDFILYEKLDGSLTTLFYYNDKWLIASRGTFCSPQAAKAQDLLDKKYEVNRLDKDTSYSFELIYPENKHVVNYGQREELVYLASFQKDGTESFDDELMENIGFPVVKTFTGYHFSEFRNHNWKNYEGAVVKFANGTRAKIKFEGYLNLFYSDIIKSPFQVWDAYIEGKSLEMMSEGLPDEVRIWLNATWEGFEAKYKEIRDRISASVEGLDPELRLKMNRGRLALQIKHDPDHKMMFALIDEKQSLLRKQICLLMKPTA